MRNKIALTLLLILILFSLFNSLGTQRVQRVAAQVVKSHERFENIKEIPTYALYQPENSGRHLNFFSHAPKETPYYPQNIWSSTIQDPYFQPIYKNYFYQDGYYYPLF